MLNEIPFSTRKTNNYLTLDILGGSSRLETPHNIDNFERLLNLIIIQNVIKQYTTAYWINTFFHYDFSSVTPNFYVKSETYNSVQNIDNSLSDTLLSDDYIIRLPPKQNFKIKIKINNIVHRRPKIIEP